MRMSTRHASACFLFVSIYVLPSRRPYNNGWEHGMAWDGMAEFSFGRLWLYGIEKWIK